jgi:hypothetical protein
MALTDAEIIELGNEIANDPTGLGLTALATRDDFDQIAPILNDTTLGETIEPQYADVMDVVAAVVAAEFGSLTAAAQRLWGQVIAGAASRGQVETKQAGIKTLIQDIWGVGTTTRSNLGALQSRPASRAEALWGENVVVTELEVAKAIWGDER